MNNTQEVLSTVEEKRGFNWVKIATIGAIAGLSIAGVAGAEDAITAQTFTDVGTKIGTYFGFAMAATVVLAGTVVAGKYGLGFLKSLFAKAT